MKTIFTIWLLAGYLLSPGLFAQKGDIMDALLTAKGELYIQVKVHGKADVDAISRIISLDHVNGDYTLATAYINRQTFDQFRFLGYSYELLPNPYETFTGIEMWDLSEKVPADWDYYPTYEGYVSMMNGFAAQHSDICKVYSIGATNQSRELLMLKISDNVNDDEAEPEFLYTSSMHGDELTAYVLMLRLTDYLLTRYGTDPRITNMVDNMEIFINPLANPDGTYKGGNSTVASAIRGNAMYIDLNRNYPDPEDGPHPDGNPWQVETVAFMDFAEENHVVMAANFHGGAEVVNYPWDTWAKLHADDSWWIYVSREYADTVHINAVPGYFTDFQNGITNGYQWYSISGGRQDYSTYFTQSRESTIEITENKTPPAYLLPSYWDYNHRSFLNYMEQAMFGLHGLVTDSITGEPLPSRIFIFGHDTDSSEAYSHLPHGYYTRLLNEGSYNVTFSCPGYHSRVISGVQIQKRQKTELNVKLLSLTAIGNEDICEHTFRIIPNPNDGDFVLNISSKTNQTGLLEVISPIGKTILIHPVELKPGANDLAFHLKGLQNGIYLLRISLEGKYFTKKMWVK